MRPPEQDAGDAASGGVEVRLKILWREGSPETKAYTGKAITSSKNYKTFVIPSCVYFI